MTSPINDLMIRIKNGYMSGKPSVIVQNSRFGKAVLEKLKRLNYIKDFSITEDAKEAEVVLNYDQDNNATFTDVEIVSKPGQRIYISVSELKPVLSGFGFAILSTPKGILTNIEAKKQNTGGELLFRIW